MWSMIEPILSWLCIIAIGGWIIYAGLIRPVVNPTPTTTQTGGVSYNYNIKVGALSCARIPSPTEQVSKAVKPVTDKIASTTKTIVK